MKRQLLLISVFTLTMLFFLSPVGLIAQTATLYGNSIVSTENTPDWYFICNSSTGEILKLSSDKTGLEPATVPLESNSNLQFWRFENKEGSIVLVNRGASGGLKNDGTWSETESETAVTFTSSGEYWIMNVDNKSLSLSSTGAALGETGTPLMFVKAPIGGGKEWVQLESYRSAASNRITFLTDNSGTVSFSATSDISSPNQHFRMVFDENTGSFYMTAKTQLGKYIYDSAKNTDANLKFSDSEEPVEFIMHPLSNRKGYVHFTVKGYPLSRIDFGPTAGLYTDSFTNAFGQRTNDGFKFVMITYSEGLSDALSSAINIATGLLSNTLLGNDPGMYSETARNLLHTVIAEAQELNENPEATELQINAAVIAINQAIAEYKTKANGIKYSTEEDITWYYIVSASTSSYATGKAIVSVSTQEGDPLKFDTKRINAHMMWCFLKDENDKISIRNMATGYHMAKNLASAASGTVSVPQHNYTISLYEGDQFNGTAFTIKSDVSTHPIHAQQNNSVIVTWQVESANPSSLWLLNEVSEEELAMDISITTSTVEQGRVTTGIGNTDLPILRTTLLGEGVKGETAMKAIKGNLTGTTNLNDVVKVKAYLASNDFELQPGKENATLLGETTPATDGTFTLTFDEPSKLQIGYNYLWVALDISENAQEGNQVDAQITSYIMSDDSEKIETNGNPEFAATIFLTESTLIRPGDNGSRYYRIPAITTAKNGWLVAVADKRWNSNSDLPNNIDVVAQVSKDNGKSWSDPIVIAGTSELGGDYGHGDPSIVTNRDNGDIIVLVTSKVGFFYGDGKDVPRMKTIISHDNGLTWDAPVDVTDQVYGAGCSDEVSKTWLSAFPTSGSILQKRDGTLVVAMPVRRPNSNIDVFLVLSEDGGKTWRPAHGNGTTNADESKVVERNNGDLLLSVRAWGQNYKNISSDNGETWQLPMETRFQGIRNANCNGDFKMFTSTLDGNDKNRMLHTNCFADNRSNVSIVISYDEGETWSSAKTICPRGSAYSALTILPDGTIGCYYEEDGLEGGYILRYVRFSVDWITNGEDTITSYAPVSIEPVKKDSADFYVTSQEGKILVVGSTNYTITSILGVTYPKDATLATGIYVVNANGKSVKTIVK